MSKKKNKLRQELSHDDFIKTQIALTQACTSIAGFNPDVEYTISSSTLPNDVKKLNSDLLKAQNLLLYISDATTEQLTKCKKYIYSIEKRISLIENKQFKYNNYADCQTIYNIIGKTQNGYFLAKLVITEKSWAHNNFCKSLFAICMNNKEYLVFDRVDTAGQVHTNKFLDVTEGKLCINDLSKRYIPAGKSHNHRYSPTAAIYAFNKFTSKQHNLIPHDALFARETMQLDAKIIDQIDNFDNLLKFNISNLNISCLEKCPEDMSLGEFYENCAIKETKMLGTLIKDKDPRVKTFHSRLPSDIILKNVSDITEISTDEKSCLSKEEFNSANNVNEIVANYNKKVNINKNKKGYKRNKINKTDYDHLL